MQISTIAQVDGTERLFAISREIGNPECGYEIPYGNLQLGELEPHRRFILDNRACWNVVRALPEKVIKSASLPDLKCVQSAITAISGGDKEWSGDVGAKIEGLTVDAAMMIVIRLLNNSKEPYSASDIPAFVERRRQSILMEHIRDVARQSAAEAGVTLSDSYHGSFIVDVREIRTLSSLTSALPYIYLSAMATLDSSMLVGLDAGATRNGYANFAEMQRALCERVNLAPSDWATALSAHDTELAGHSDRWEKNGNAETPRAPA